MRWRQKEVTKIFEGMRKAVSNAKLNANLIIVALGFPELDALAGSDPIAVAGLDKQWVRSQRNVVYLQPESVNPFKSLVEKKENLILKSDASDRDAADKSAANENAFEHQYMVTHFEQFEKQKPFGESPGPLFRMQQLTPSGDWNRQRFIKAPG